MQQVPLPNSWKAIGPTWKRDSVEHLCCWNYAHEFGGTPPTSVVHALTPTLALVPAKPKTRNNKKQDINQNKPDNFIPKQLAHIVVQLVLVGLVRLFCDRIQAWRGHGVQ